LRNNFKLYVKKNSFLTWSVHISLQTCAKPIERVNAFESVPPLYLAIATSQFSANDPS